jgi:hypothetical protein
MRKPLMLIFLFSNAFTAAGNCGLKVVRQSPYFTVNKVFQWSVCCEKPAKEQKDKYKKKITLVIFF